MQLQSSCLAILQALRRRPITLCTVLWVTIVERLRSYLHPSGLLISISGPDFRLTPERVTRVARPLMAETSALSTRLGYLHENEGAS